MKPLLKWAGGKRWQAATVRLIYDGDRRFVEPFCGGAAMSFDLTPTAAVLNDANPHVVNFYRYVAIGMYVDSVDGDEAAYYAVRSRFNALVAAGEHQCAEAARLFYHLNKRGYNGLCRFNRLGEFNVPYGGNDYKSLVEPRFDVYARLLSAWTVSCGDFASVVLDPRDFVYADPPYDGTFTDYVAGGFQWADQVRCAERFAAHVGPVVLVNHATDRIVRLYRDYGYDVEFIDAPRSISCDGDRETAQEVFAVRNVSNPARKLF